jgi:hypothetical protein
MIKSKTLRRTDVLILTPENEILGPFFTIDAAAESLGINAPSPMHAMISILNFIIVAHRTNQGSEIYVRGHLASLSPDRSEHLSDLLELISEDDQHIVYKDESQHHASVTDKQNARRSLAYIQGRHIAIPMTVQDMSDSAILNRPIATTLVKAWLADSRTLGDNLIGTIIENDLSKRMVVYDVSTLRISWAGSGLTYLNQQPNRLEDIPISALADQNFTKSLVVDLYRTSATQNPTLSRIKGTLNDVNVDYEVLTLTIPDARNKNLVRSVRFPMNLVVDDPNVKNVLLPDGRTKKRQLAKTER